MVCEVDILFNYILSIWKSFWCSINKVLLLLIKGLVARSPEKLMIKLWTSIRKRKGRRKNGSLAGGIMKAKGKAYVPDACKQCAFQEHIFHCVFVLPSNIYVLLATITKRNIMRREEKKKESRYVTPGSKKNC